MFLNFPQINLLLCLSERLKLSNVWKANRLRTIVEHIVWPRKIGVRR